MASPWSAGFATMLPSAASIGTAMRWGALVARNRREGDGLM